MTAISRVFRAGVALAGIVAIGFGLTLPATGSQSRWLGCLLLGGLLMGIGLWPRSSMFAAANRPIVNVVAVIALSFGLLGVQMTRVQVLSSRSIAESSGTDPVSGDVLSNPRLVDATVNVRRGTIFDRAGEVLAESELQNGGYDRRYPISDASYVCGYFSPLKYGNTGLEASFDDELGGAYAEKSLSGNLDRLLGRDAVGADLYLTLDASLQQQAHAVLGDQIGSVIVIEVATGAVLVLASNPHVDPNKLVAIDAKSVESASNYWGSLQNDPTKPLILRATDGLYTPGSTFKTITAAAAIDAGDAKPTDVYQDNGQLDVDGHVIVEANRPDNSIDQWTLAEGLAFSLNVVFALVGLEIGSDTLVHYAERFGFRDHIPFDLPVASGQIESTPDFLDSPAALADTAFGQGELLTTPLGMALVAAGLANGGRIMQPYLVDRVVSASGDEVKSAKPTVWRQPVNSETAEMVRDMMVGAVENGYASSAAIPGLVVGGKTGTAETGSGDPHAWFIGFAGDPEPRYAVAVVLEHGGSGTQKPIAIARDILAATMDSTKS